MSGARCEESCGFVNPNDPDANPCPSQCHHDQGHDGIHWCGQHPAELYPGNN